MVDGPDESRPARRAGGLTPATLRYTDFLKATVMLMAAEATALAAVTSPSRRPRGQDHAHLRARLVGDRGVLGVWLGRRHETTAAIGDLLAAARSTNTLPEIRPARCCSTGSGCWRLDGVAAGLSWLFPQVAAVVAGGAILIALAWRKQERR